MSSFNPKIRILAPGGKVSERRRQFMSPENRLVYNKQVEEKRKKQERVEQERIKKEKIENYIKKIKYIISGNGYSNLNAPIITESDRLTANLLNTIYHSDIKNVINEDFENAILSKIENRNITPSYENINGVKVFIFNQPSTEFQEDFNNLLKKYKIYYNKIENSHNMNFIRDPNFTNLSRIDYQKRRVRNFNRELTTESNEGLLEFFRKRIKHFEKCGSEFQREYIQNELKGDPSLYTNENVSSLTKEQKENFIFQKYLNFFREEKNREERIMTNYNTKIKSVQNNVNKIQNIKNKEISNLKSKQLTELFNDIKFGPKNKEFDPNILKCKLGKLSNNINENITKKKEIYSLIQKYISIQKNKVFLFGLLVYYRTFYHCRKIFHVSPGVLLSRKYTNKSIFNNILFNEPITSELSTNSLCHKYILWTPYLNYFFIISALKKSINIPLIIYRPQNNYHFLPKYRDPINDKDFFVKINGEDIKKMNFIGVIDIPYKDEYKILHKYIFIFQHPKGKYFKNYMSSQSTPYLLVDKDKYLVSEGHILPQNVISYDEIAYLYYLSQEPEKKLIPYFYCDPNIPNFIMVSLKINLDQIEPYKSYGLKKVKLEPWYQNGRKQFIFKFENNNSSLPTSIQELKNNHNQLKYIMTTIQKINNLKE